MTATRINVSSGRPLEAKAHYSRALRVGTGVLQSGTTAIDREGQVIGEGDISRQVDAIFSIAGESMGAAGGRLEDVVCVRLYVTDSALADAACRRCAHHLGDARPALSVVPVRALARPTQLIEIELEAIDNAAATATRLMRGHPAEEAYGVSAALRVEDRVWVSGAVGIGALDPHASAAGQTREAFAWIESLLQEAGARSSDLVCTRVSLRDLEDLAAFRDARKEALGPLRPASTLVCTPAFAHPAQRIEVEAEAVVGAAKRRREWFAPGGADRRAGFARAVGAGDRIYVSGCVAMDPEGKVVAPGDWSTQIDHGIAQIRDVLEEAGSSLGDVVQRRTFTVAGATMNRAYGEGPPWFAASRPAALGCRIDGLIHPELIVEVDAVAVRGAHAGIEWRTLP